MKRHTILTVALALTLGLAANGLAGTDPESGAVRTSGGPALEGVTIERLPDRVRVTVDGVKEADTYHVEDSRVPPMVAVAISGSEGAMGGEWLVEQSPLRRVVRDQMAAPNKGSRLVFQLSEHVTPEVSRTRDGLRVDFPTRLLSGAPASAVTAIHIHPLNGETAVVVSADGHVDYEAQMVRGNRLVLDLAGLSTDLASPIQVETNPLLERIRIGKHAEKVRLVFDLTGPSHYVVEQAASSLTVRLARDRDGTEAGVAAHAAPVAGTATAMSAAGSTPTAIARVPRSVHTEALLATAHGLTVKPQLVQMANISERKPQDEAVVDQPRYVGRRMSLDFQAAEITNVLRLIAEVSGFNIVVGEGVKSKVTMKIVNVPWDQALDMLLKMNGLGMIKQGNIVWVDTLGNIAKQQQEEANAKNSKTAAEELVTRIFYLRNVQAQEVLQSLRQYITSRGQMQANVGSNALIVRDVESKIGVIKQMIDGLDIQVPQVEIEARVVQANTNYTRALGIQWGFSNVNQLGSANGVANFRAGTSGPFGAPISDFLVNLPATVAGLVPPPSVGFQFGKTDGALLDLRLSAGEALGLTKVIASPKITTLDKRDARISQGESIPFQTVSLQGTQTTFVDANLELQVTPQITSRDPNEVAKQIMMKVRATRNAVGARSNPAGPSIDKREANTQVLVRDGETMVIGGVYVDAQQNNVNGVPYLSRIPVLGWLFKNKIEDIARQELLIFLTPNIVKS